MRRLRFSASLADYRYPPPAEIGVAVTVEKAQYLGRESAITQRLPRSSWAETIHPVMILVAFG
jgi:hypothetical protein